MIAKKKIVLLLGLLVGGLSAHAGGSARVVCSNNAVPQLVVSHNTAPDSGTPGLFWLGIISSDMKLGAVLTPQGWNEYQGGLYPFQARYDNGMPPTISLTLSFPSSNQSTREWVGYTLYTGHGAYTSTMQRKVADRRTALQSVKPDMVAKGRWRPEFDSDDHYMWSLIQQDMTDNNKYAPVFIIPYVDCSPQSGGGD